MERIPSCTMPTFSKIAVTLRATQPAVLVICHASAIAVATSPTAMRPCDHKVIASAAMPTSSTAFIAVSDRISVEIIRVCARNAAVCSSTDSRTKASSSRGLANSLTVRMLV